MGDICSSVDAQVEFVNQPIKISIENFKEVSSADIKLEQLQQLSNHQIPGELLNNKVYKKSNETYFIGSIQQNETSKQGILYLPLKGLYYGQLQDRLINGYGTLIFLKNHLSYKGQFKDGKPNGKGILKCQPQKFQFDGTWKQDKKTKKTTPISGVLRLFQHKNIQQIQFDSFPHKNAIITYKNGSKYSGFIQKNTLLPIGIGKMTYYNEDIYQGQWNNGRFQGSGTYTWKNGQKYIGDYFQGLKHGQGYYYFNNGNIFEGVWSNGQKNGLGKVLKGNGVVIEKGIYKNDKFDAQLTMAFNQNSMQKAPRQQLKSQLLDINQNRQDLQVKRK